MQQFPTGSQEPASASANAGWYADPSDAAFIRYWNGKQWADDRTPAGPSGPAHPLLGAQQATTQPLVGSVKKTNSKAIWSLVLGLIGLLIGVAAIPGLILGIMGHGELQRKPYESGGGLAIAGIVVSSVALVGWILILATMGA